MPDVSSPPATGLLVFPVSEPNTSRLPSGAQRSLAKLGQVRSELLEQVDFKMKSTTPLVTCHRHRSRKTWIWEVVGQGKTMSKSVGHVQVFTIFWSYQVR